MIVEEKSRFRRVVAVLVASLLSSLAEVSSARDDEPPHDDGPSAPNASPSSPSPAAPPDARLRGVSAPVLVAGGEVPYPESGRGDAKVVLELVVAKDGSVQDARVVEGDEPFAEAALVASRGFRFDPAMRDGVPVPARIRMPFSFVAPVEPEPPGPTPSPTSGAPKPPSEVPRAAPVEQVEVRGKRKEAGQTTLGQAEIRDIPGAFGDAFRAIETLPGVVPMASGLPFFFVRGAPPGNTGYLLDGIRVPLLYHLALGPAVVHPGMIDRVDFFAGAPPARFGKFAGGFVSGELREPAKRFHGEGNIRLFDAGALAEAPFANGKGTALVAGRYSYTALLFSLFVPETRLDYWDYQARVAYDLTPDDRVSVFAFGSHDYLGEVKTRGGETETRTVFATQFHRLDTRYDRKIEGGRVRAAVTLGIDVSAFGEDKSTRDRMLAARWELEKRLSPELLFRGGADVVLDHYDLVDGAEETDERFSQLYPPRNDVAIGLRADLVWKVTPRIEVVPGIRGDLFGSWSTGLRRSSISGEDAAIPSLDPRLATRVKLSPRVTYVSTLGLQHQPPAFVLPVPGLQIGRLSDGLQSTIHASQGAEIELPAKITVVPTVFVANAFGLSDATAVCPNQGDILDRDCSRRVSGRTYGLELAIRRSFGERLTGFLTYTLSRSTRLTRPVLFFRGLGGLGINVPEREIAGEFDRTHVLNVAGSYTIGAGWRAGARFFFYTGRPYTETLSGVPLPPYNAYRLPDFYRFDFRVEKRWTFGESGYVSFVAEWLNATLRKEAFQVKCRDIGETGFESAVPGQRCVPDEVGPITIPSLGVEGGF